MTQHVWEFFHNIDTENVEDVLIKDVCAVMMDTCIELNAALRRKIMIVEEAIKDIPDLTPFDHFGVKVF